MHPIQAVLFDLDGTLLPMEQNTFIKAYFGALAQYMQPHGFHPKELIETVMAGSNAMIANDGTCTNETAFWRVMQASYGAAVRAHEPTFAAFYREVFPQVQQVCGHQPRAGALVHALRAAGVTVALATNPIFPRVATLERMRWAGLDEADLALVTTYENSTTCKPNPAYYAQVAAALGVDPAHCLMVGNDVGDDLPARQVGMAVFLLTDCLINPTQAPLAEPHGDFDALVRHLQPLLGGAAV